VTVTRLHVQKTPFHAANEMLLLNGIQAYSVRNKNYHLAKLWTYILLLCAIVNYVF